MNRELLKIVFVATIALLAIRSSETISAQERPSNPLRENADWPGNGVLPFEERGVEFSRDSNVAPVVWQALEGTEDLPPPPTDLLSESPTDLLERGSPSTNQTILSDDERLAPFESSTLSPQECWPDEDYGYDPNVPRGRLRRTLFGLRSMIATATGIGFSHEQRYVGLGQPLTNTSWLNRPWSFGGFVGIQFHDQLLAGQLGQSNSAVGGARLGLDFDYYWGLEARFAYSNPDTTIPGIPAVRDSSHNYYVDLNLMYYPWGDSRWRPYFSVGLGSGTYRFQDNGISVSDSGLRIPLAMGLKYYYSPWFTLRFDAQYASTFLSDNFDAQNEFMLNFGAEVRFGGSRQSYFPWHSGAVFW